MEFHSLRTSNISLLTFHTPPSFFIPHCLLLTSDSLLLTSSSHSLLIYTPRSSLIHFWMHSLFKSHSCFFLIHSSFLTIDCLLFIPHFSLRTSPQSSTSLLPSHSLEFTIHFSLIISHYSLLSQCTIAYAVEFGFLQ